MTLIQYFDVIIALLVAGVAGWKVRSAVFKHRQRKLSQQRALRRSDREFKIVGLTAEDDVVLTDKPSRSTRQGKQADNDIKHM